MKKLLYLTILSILLSACESQEKKIDRYKQEVTDTELAFAAMAKEAGIALAFESFAAGDVVMLRGDKLVEGKDALIEYYAGTDPESVKLEWAPDFVDVSASGDLAYTYGKYTFTAIDSTGNKKSAQGIFHTVWKRQEDGKWKFVWD